MVPGHSVGVGPATSAHTRGAPWPERDVAHAVSLHHRGRRLHRLKQRDRRSDNLIRRFAVVPGRIGLIQVRAIGKLGLLDDRGQVAAAAGLVGSYGETAGPGKPEPGLRTHSGRT